MVAGWLTFFSEPSLLLSSLVSALDVCSAKDWDNILYIVVNCWNFRATFLRSFEFQGWSHPVWK